MKMEQIKKMFKKIDIWSLYYRTEIVWFIFGFIIGAILKSITTTNPKFNGALYYTNKKGKYVCHSIMKGKKQTDVFWKNPKVANMTKGTV
jgi:hypothetical protein